MSTSGRSPPLSIGMPVRNGEAYIRGALEALLAQTFTDFVLLIGDNASSDGTEAICREVAGRDRRVRYHRHAENVGASRNFNFLFQTTTGPYFKWAAHDDSCEPAFLQRCIDRLERDPSPVLCHTYTNEIGERGELRGRYDDQLSLLADRPSQRLAALFRLEYPSPVWGVMRRDAVARTRLFGGFLGSDWNFLAEMLLLGPIALVPEYLFSVRNHDAGFSFGFQRTSKAVRLAWFDPQKREPGLASAATSTFRFAEAILRHPLPIQERAACLRHLAGRTWRKFAGKLSRRSPGAATPPRPAPLPLSVHPGNAGIEEPGR